MRMMIHDYSGHAFAVGLSRELARRGHEVLHVYSAGFETPRGDLERRAADPPGLEIVPVRLGEAFHKHDLLRRWVQEREIGRLVAEEVERFGPDVVISANAPLDTQKIIARVVRRIGAAFVFWQQDIYSEAIARLLPERLPMLGDLVARRYRRLEASLLRRAEHVVPITADFVRPLLRQGIGPERLTVIENWGPVAELPPLPRDNPWSDANLGEGLRIVYSGTLGLKHDHRILLEMARATGGQVHVFSEGPSAESLRAEAQAEGVANLHVRGWVPFADLAGLLCGADILVALLDEDAGAYSVPSKVLSYMCAGRPVIAALPRANLARRLIEREAAGLVFDPADRRGLLEGLRRLAADPDLRKRMGANARAHAERAFDIRSVCDRFERVARLSLKRSRSGSWRASAVSANGAVR